MIACELSAADLTWADDIGLARFRESKAFGHEERFHERLATGLAGAGRGEERSAVGARAELGLARATGREWLAGVNRWSDPDVAPDIDVRYSSERRDLRVRLRDVHDRDKCAWRFVLAWGLDEPWPVAFELVGWCYGHEAEELATFRREATATVFVPPARLRPIEELVVAVGQGTLF